MTNTIHFVSLGPGDPELITLKGLKILQHADIIYCPGTRSKEGVISSRSSHIIKGLNILTPVCIYTIPMKKDRSAAVDAYVSLQQQVVADYHSGKKVAIVAEGDAGFYSSSQYIYEALLAESLPVDRVAGIPAFIAAGALAGLHIVKQEEHLHVIPGETTVSELSILIEKGYVVVVMKLSQCRAAIHESMLKYPEVTWHYFENVGSTDEFYTSDVEAIKNREFPYFSLMIIGGKIKLP